MLSYPLCTRDRFCVDRIGKCFACVISKPIPIYLPPSYSLFNCKPSLKCTTVSGLCVLVSLILHSPYMSQEGDLEPSVHRHMLGETHTPPRHGGSQIAARENESEARTDVIPPGHVCRNGVHFKTNSMKNFSIYILHQHSLILFIA